MPDRSMDLLRRATNRADRQVMVGSLLMIVGLAIYLFLRPAGQQAVVQRDDQTVLTLSLSHDQQQEVAGRLGPVVIQVQGGRVRLLEYASPRLIGTRSGWIASAGAMVACVPCGILVRVAGEEAPQSSPDHFDGIAR
ncbi:MAG: NusG domain II-containing protein [Magnetococcus sp. DMHC-8]